MWWWILPFAPEIPERLIVGNERTFLTWFYERHVVNKQALTPAAVDEYLRTFSGREGVLGALGIYRAAFQSIEQTEPLTQSKIQTPVVAIGGVKGLGARVGTMVRLVAGRVGEKATPVARPTLPSSNRRCRFPASGSPESSRLRHAQCPIDGSAPSAPNAEAIVLLADDGMASGCAVANAGSDGPERSVRSHSRYSRDTRRKSSSSILSGADSALQPRPG